MCIAWHDISGNEGKSVIYAIAHGMAILQRGGKRLLATDYNIIICWCLLENIINFGQPETHSYRYDRVTADHTNERSAIGLINHDIQGAG